MFLVKSRSSNDPSIWVVIHCKWANWSEWRSAPWQEQAQTLVYAPIFCRKVLQILVDAQLHQLCSLRAVLPCHKEGWWYHELFLVVPSNRTRGVPSEHEGTVLYCECVWTLAQVAVLELLQSHLGMVWGSCL